jgi:hypothetical protein
MSGRDSDNNQQEAIERIGAALEAGLTSSGPDDVKNIPGALYAVARGLHTNMDVETATNALFDIAQALRSVARAIRGEKETEK